jgi:drug/metabolite transporter (DMT)-like permease
MFKNNAVFGILLMVLSTAALASKDGIVKTVLDQANPIQTLWIQFIGTFAVMALISMSKHGLAAILPTSPVKQLVRGVLNVSAILAFFMALKYIPIADVTALLLFAPIVVTILSPFF